MKGSNSTIAEVVRNNLCTGCGTCISLCPEGAIELTNDIVHGIYYAQLDEGKCNKCGICFAVCPGHSVDSYTLNQDIFGKQPEDMLLGNNINCYLGYATDYAIRYNASSGGIVTALLVFALEEGIIDGALVIKMKDNSPLEPQPFIARTREEIIAASKSKYCPVAANMAVKDILNQEGRFAVVGLPCHIHGIRKAEMLNKKLRQRIVFHLGLFCCGHTDTFLGTEFVLRRYGIVTKDISRLDYRGEGWPGYMTIMLRDGQKKRILHHDYMIYHTLGFFSPRRCALCYDGINDLSDISLGDAWLPELSNEKIGTSVVVSRSSKGELFLQQAIKKGMLTLEPIDREKVRRMESKKIAYRIKSGIAKLLGRKCPNYSLKLPGFGFGFPPPPLFYLCMELSGRRSWWIIEPLATTLRFFMQIGKKLLRR